MIRQVVVPRRWATAVLACFLCQCACVAQTRKPVHRSTDAPASASAMLQAAQAEHAPLVAVYQAATRDAMDAAKSRVHSRVGQMVIAAKTYQFDGNAAGAGVLAVLPRNVQEAQALQQFSTGDFAGLDRYFYGAATSSLPQHPAMLHAYLSVAIYVSADWFCAELEKVHGSMPAQYDADTARFAATDREYLESCKTPQ